MARKVELLLNDGILVLNGGRDDDLSLSVNDSAAATLSKRGNQKKYTYYSFKIKKRLAGIAGDSYFGAFK